MRCMIMKMVSTLFWSVAHKQLMFRPLGAAYAFTSTATRKFDKNGNNGVQIARLTTATARHFGGRSSLSSATTSSSSSTDSTRMKINLQTIPAEELRTILKSWGNYPAYRADQILHWVREKGVVSDFDEMNNIPKKLRELLKEHAGGSNLSLEVELKSKDGTKKRAYRLWDGQLIESVLMPYEDGRNTACISSQAGCAMGCVFCATGQMGFARQLTSDEIFEQVAQFASELKAENQRLSNVVMMGMGEPLANYKNVMEAIQRMNSELGIGARKITVSTVGIVPNIRKLMDSDALPVRLAVSLHCSTEEERSALLPANKRYGGLHTLMTTIADYIETTKRRVTFEWALIENENDSPEVARQLGRLLIQQYNLRKDMIHINLIPLNPTGGFGGGPSGRAKVHNFVRVLDQEFGIAATPRMRRGIDIEAGCGQLKAAVQKKEGKIDAEKTNTVETNAKSNLIRQPDELSPKVELMSFMDSPPPITVGVYEDDDYCDDTTTNNNNNNKPDSRIVDFTIDSQAINFDDEDDEECLEDLDLLEADRLINLVSNTVLNLNELSPPQTKMTTEEEEEDAVSEIEIITLPNNQDIVKGPTTSITSEDAIRQAKRRRKKLIKNLKAIEKLKLKEQNVSQLSDQEIVKINREKEWREELESVEHNLQ